jgi:organic radical activating enzyme
MSAKRTYALTELFTSIQGEGPAVGRRATFVRFAGCNLACPFCDTNHQRRHEYSGPELLREICVRVGQCKSAYVVLTGGEPLLQVDHELLWALLHQGLEVGIESNGSWAAGAAYGVGLGPDGIEPLDRCELVVSPKGPEVDPLLIKRAAALKVVYPFPVNVGPQDVFAWAADMAHGAWMQLQPVTPGHGARRYPNWAAADRDEWARNCEGAVRMAEQLQWQMGRTWRVIPQTHVWMQLP